MAGKVLIPEHNSTGQLSWTTYPFKKVLWCFTSLGKHQNGQQIHNGHKNCRNEPVYTMTTSLAFSDTIYIITKICFHLIRHFKCCSISCSPNMNVSVIAYRPMASVLPEWTCHFHKTTVSFMCSDTICWKCYLTYKFYPSNHLHNEWLKLYFCKDCCLR